MQKKVIYCQNIYRPGKEGISNEIVQLRAYLAAQGFTTDVLFRSITDIKTSSFLRDWVRLKIRIHHDDFLRDAVCHVWGSGRMSFFHLLLPREYKNVITLINTEGIATTVRAIKEYSHIVVETALDKQTLHHAGVDPSRIQVIYPCFPYKTEITNSSLITEPHHPLRILFASVPFDEWDLENRGVDLLIQAARCLGDEAQITFLCRTLAIYNTIRRRFAQDLSQVENVILKHGPRGMRQVFAEVDVVILPFRRNRKSFPNSMVEAISLGKPVIVSHVVAASTLVEQTGCGIVVKPTAESICRGVEQARLIFRDLVHNCVKATNEIFSPEQFWQGYEKIYRECLN